MENDRGSFIVVDGGDGTGTTSLVDYLGRYVSDNVHMTREPGGSVFGERVRELIKSDDAKHADANTLFALFWAARADHMHNVVIPTLKQGMHVVSDRFDASTFAYQIFGEQHEHLADLFWYMRGKYLGSWKPDCYLILDVDPQEGLARVEKRSAERDHFDERTLAFHRRAREGYHTFAGMVGATRIDATHPMNRVRSEAVRALGELLTP